MIPKFQLGGGSVLFTATELEDAIKEGMDPVRFDIVRRWPHSLPGVATECRAVTPYGPVRRVS